MWKALRAVHALGLVSCLGGCAATQVTPVAMSQSNDEQLTCPQISSEQEANLKDAREFFKKDSDTEVLNVFRSVLCCPDLSNDDQVRARALVDRNERLTYLATTKGCAKQ